MRSEQTEGPHDAAFEARTSAQWARYDAIHKAALARADADPHGTFKAAIKERWLAAHSSFLTARSRAVTFLDAAEIARQLALADTALDALDALTREAA